jgi:hypothetical protein
MLKKAKQYKHITLENHKLFYGKRQTKVKFCLKQFVINITIFKTIFYFPLNINAAK